MVRCALAVLLLLGACGEKTAPDPAGPERASLDPPGPDRTASDPGRPVTTTTGGAVPVRVGEAGPAFRACASAGTPRSTEPLIVRAGPFDNAAVVGGIAPGARVFVCTRTMDQRWMGIVYEAGGTLSPGCGVSVPMPAEADYAGACRSGWVASVAVRSVAG